MSWIELQKGKYSERKIQKLSNCQYEFKIE